MYKRQELGCLNTHFTNASGLTDVNHYTTAYDMALILSLIHIYVFSGNRHFIRKITSGISFGGGCVNDRPFIGNELIKVLTGIRRSGKSLMLSLIQEELAQNGVQPEQFISLNFENMSLSLIHI